AEPRTGFEQSDLAKIGTKLFEKLGGEQSAWAAADNGNLRHEIPVSKDVSIYRVLLYRRSIFAHAARAESTCLLNPSAFGRFRRGSRLMPNSFLGTSRSARTISWRLEAGFMSLTCGIGKCYDIAKR